MLAFNLVFICWMIQCAQELAEAGKQNYWCTGSTVTYDFAFTLHFVQWLEPFPGVSIWAPHINNGTNPEICSHVKTALACLCTQGLFCFSSPLMQCVWPRFLVLIRYSVHVISDFNGKNKNLKTKSSFGVLLRLLHWQSTRLFQETNRYIYLNKLY